MGATCVDVTIRNPADPARSWTGPFLVDTGAFDTLVPKAHLEAIGLKPRAVREYPLANGERVTLEVTVAELEFEGEIVGGTVVYGDDDSEAGLARCDSAGFRGLRGGSSQSGTEAAAGRLAQGHAHDGRPEWLVRR